MVGNASNHYLRYQSHGAAKRRGLRDTLNFPKEENLSEMNNNDRYLTSEVLFNFANSREEIAMHRIARTNSFLDYKIVDKKNHECNAFPSNLSNTNIVITLNNSPEINFSTLDDFPEINLSKQTRVENFLLPRKPLSRKNIKLHIFKTNVMGSYKNSVCRPLSSPSSVNEKSDIVPSDDRPQIITTRGGNINSRPAPVRSEPGRISFLEVPIASDLRRPSTADIVIKKLKVEKLEGGGLTISGFVLTGNCHIALIIFGLFFLLAGIVLTYVGFAVCTHHHHDAEPVSQALGSSAGKIHESDNHKQMQITGPIFMILGIIMLMIGMSLCGITSKVSKEANARRIAMSTAQLSQMEGNFFQSQSTAYNSPVHTTAPGPNQAYPILSLRRGSVWMEPTPIEFPQYKSESAVPSSDVATLDPARRSSSPMLNNNTQIWTQPKPVVNQGQHMSSKRLSSPHINIYYGDEASMDIATFPSEDYVSNSSPYPGGVVPSDPNRRESAKSEQKSQILEVVEANKCETQTISSSDEKTDSKPEIPRITVSDGSDVQCPSEFHGEFKDNFVTNMTMSIASNLPLAKNGISLPRLSRHSMSRSEIPQATRSSSQSFEDR